MPVSKNVYGGQDVYVCDTHEILGIFCNPLLPPIFSTVGAESAQFCLFRTRTSWSKACNHQSEPSAIFEAVLGAARHLVVHSRYFEHT